jgi:hypothetical protein
MTTMIRVIIELLPHGFEDGKETIGLIEIANDGIKSKEDLTKGDYQYKMMKSSRYAKRPGVYKQGSIKGFPRKRLGPYDLLFRVLSDAVGSRNG